MSSLPIQTVIDWMVELAPLHLAANWDNCGLQVGDPSTPLRGIAVAVDPTYEAVQQAIAQGANLVIVHHPLLFKATKRLDLRQEPGRTIQALIKHDVVLYAAHTNLDATAVNVALANTLGLTGQRVLDVIGRSTDYKLGVYVPQAAADAVREAAWAAGAGKGPRYERAAYALEATGTFRPLAGAQPAEGTPGAQAEAPAVRLEFLVPGAVLANVRAAIRSAHPYEEPAIDVVALEGGGEPYGYGLVGDVAEQSLQALAQKVKQALGLKAVRIVGDPERAVRRVAWLGGSGGDYFPQALASGAQAYITGEVRHHAALDALAAGLSFIEVGHVGSEQPVVPYLKAFLERKLAEATEGKLAEASLGAVPVHALDQVDPFIVL